MGAAPIAGQPTTVNIAGEDCAVLLAARFDDRVKKFWWISGLFFCIFIPFFGWLMLLPWILCGGAICTNYLNRLEVLVTSRALIIRKGGILGNCVARVEKVILLDRIQDVTLSQGCLMKCYGVELLTIETAGQSGPGAGPEMALPGIADARHFRDSVLQLRHQLVEKGVASDGLGLATATSYARPMTAGTGPSNAEMQGVLTDIRDVLLRMEQGNAGIAQAAN